MKIIKGFGITIAVLTLVVFYFQVVSGGETDYRHKYEDEADLNANVDGLERDGTYAQYRAMHDQAPVGRDALVVPVSNPVSGEGFYVADHYEGREDVLVCEDASIVTFSVHVPSSGWYHIQVDYFAIASRGADMERRLYINGEVPFLGAEQLVFNRIWVDAAPVRQDNQGHDIRPAQIDQPDWMQAYLKDHLGYHTDPFMFFFEAGENTLTLEAINEPMAIQNITLMPPVALPNYEAYIDQYENLVATGVQNFQDMVEGEHAIRRSSPSLYAIYDRSAPDTVPYSVTNIRLNMIGGYAWRMPGQWIEWEIEVPKDGFYRIDLKARQNYSRGFVSNRTLYINGEVPFEEVSAIPFLYSNRWEQNPLADAITGEPYQFFLKEGTNTLRLEVTLGDLGPILSDLEASVYRLNAMYRKILVLTGTQPDEFRDYKIEQVYPEVMLGMHLESLRLYKFVDDVVAYSGQKASQVAAAQTLAEQMEMFVSRPERIPRTFINFKDNISAIGTSIMTLSEAPLDIDRIIVSSMDQAPDFKTSNFAQRSFHEIRSFLASFSADYNAVGNVYDDDDVVEVWILTGRDQSTILKTMIDDTFTPHTDIKVNLKLVDGATLINAIIAGTGPDVVLSAPQPDPVNLALRGAIEDLTQFDDYKKVLEDFYASAYTPFQFEGGLYALPETQNFNVLFYRKDILEELGVEVPQTWTDLIHLLPTIQQENMSVAIPTTERLINNISNPDLSNFFAMTYQNGGTIYDQQGLRTVIDEPEGIQAFEMFTKMFTQYSLPTVYDFPNRFRSGEMPLGIQDYSVYNMLVVFAPEIRGLWDFTLIPGIKQPDGTIDRSVHTWGTGTYMIRQEDARIRENAWTFMKWWVSTESQVRFGQEMESVMGASARFATANVSAFEQLAWSHEQIAVLKEQWEWTRGIQEIAGGYYTPRHITNAIRKVINDQEDAREVLLDYVININDEIHKKRVEFGLSVD